MQSLVQAPGTQSRICNFQDYYNELIIIQGWITFLLNFLISFIYVFFIPVKSVDVKVDILILSFGEIQEANMVSFGVGMLVYILTVEVF